ncbi:hypothetical protein FNF29_08180 [Cafeteria roenbergensis]|uniref:Uncharacterized protein n=1 Tax=Cafeteria roenbergensis TaxID=33653 RepID=A0A5A8C311_CAFRO|nr:hypothetical protein FNF29_08180 [Cafeteria roenbergensis]|eukprot:KAA0146231.1 hypothetical protein FNF29_08180 [Cafeteria roenbergensis]
MGTRKETVVPVSLHVDVPSKAVVVTYERIIESFDEAGERLGSERHTSRKNIRLKSLSASTNVAGLAEQIMSKCSTIIGEDRVGELIEKISELQRAHLAATGEARAAQRPAKPAAGGDGTEELLAAMNRKAGSSAGDSAPRGHASEESASAGERDPRKRPASASRRGPREGRPKDGGGARGASGDGGGKEGESDSEGAAGPAAGAGLDEVDAATAEEARAAAAELEADRARAAAAQENLRRAEALAEETKRGLAEAERVAASEQRERALRMREHEAQARVRDVESYLELLYEEDPKQRQEGASLILALARHADTLPALLDHGTLLGALSRVLREDYKKSGELAGTIVQVFYCISRLSDQQGVVADQRVGDVTIRIIELETKRHAARLKDLERIEALAKVQESGSASEEAEFRERDERRRARANAGEDFDDDEEGDDDGDGADSGAGRAAAAATGASTAKVRRSGKARAAKAARAAKVRMKLKPLPEGKVNLAKERRRTRLLARRQERLLFPALHLLLNLAEDDELERKMCRRGIVGLLVGLLGRAHRELLLLVATFLRKLSLIEENKDEMASLDIVPAIARWIPSGDTPLTLAMLRLLFNLSFDQSLCARIVAVGLLPRIAALLRHAPFRAVVLRVLYHISIDDDHKAVFAETDAVRLVRQIVIAVPSAVLPDELAGLAVNLTLHPLPAQQFLEDGGAAEIMARVTKTRDPRAMRILRNIAWHTLCMQAEAADAVWDGVLRGQSLPTWAQLRRRRGRRGRKDRKDDSGLTADQSPLAPGAPGMGDADVDFPNIIDSYRYRLERLWPELLRDIVRLLAVDDADLRIEVMGTLNCLTPRDFPPHLGWADVLAMPAMAALLERVLTPGYAEDDMCLEGVQLVAAALLDPEAAKPLAAMPALSLLAEILEDKASDAEMVLQVAVAMGRALRHAPTRQVLLYETDGVQRLCAFLAVPDPLMAGVIDEVARVAMDWDREVGKKSIWRVVQAARFRAHNQHWCAAVAAGAGGGTAAAGAGGRHGGGSGFAADDSGWSHEDDDDDDSHGGALQRRYHRDASGDATPPGGHLGRYTHESVALDATGVLASAGQAESPYSEGWRSDDGPPRGAAAGGVYWGQRS